jgi:pimeloyl-ACP methyl ester carboxylesterase
MGTAYDLSGPEDAPVVVLVHGLGLSRAIWQWLVPLLASQFRVVSYDLIGHGRTVVPVGKPVLRDLAHQLEILIDHLGVAKAAIVGFSLGGMVARRFSQDCPDRVTALVILHSPHRRTQAQQAAIVARVEQTKDVGPAATVEAALVRWYTDNARASRAELMEQTRAWVMANDLILATGIEEIVTPVPPIACPTLVLTADEDYGNGPEMSAAIAAEISGAELLILNGLRHMALAENPDAVNGPVFAFLTKVLG